MGERCEECGRRFDRPSFNSKGDCLSGGHVILHPPPTLAQRIVEAVEVRLAQSHKRFRWRDEDPDIADAVRDSLAGEVSLELSKAGVEIVNPHLKELA